MNAQILFVFGPQACIPDDGLAAARRRGYRTTVFGARLACCMSADLVDRFERCDLGRTDEVVAAARRLHDADPVDAVVAYDDHAVPVAAHVAEALDLPGNPPAAAAAARDKLVMKERFREAGLPIGPHHLASDEDDAAAWARERGFPVVVKPLRGSASQGVIRADSEDELRAAYRRLRLIVREQGLDTAGRSDAHQLVEGFLPGREYSVEVLVQGGRSLVLCTFEKPRPLDGPFFEESIYVSPARLNGEQRRRLEALAVAGVRALGLTDGAAHCEVRFDGDRLYLLEIGARLIGGACARVFDSVLEENIHDYVLDLALGRKLSEPRHRPGFAGAMMLPIPGTGRLRMVRGLDRAREVTGIQDVILNASPGDLVVPFPEQSCYVGFLTASGATFEAVERSLASAAERIELDLEELGCRVLARSIQDQADYRAPEDLGIRTLEGFTLEEAEPEVLPVIAGTYFGELPEDLALEKARGCLHWFAAGNRGETAPESWFYTPGRGVALGSASDGTAYASLVGVLPEGRRSGLGQALMRSVMAHYARRGCTRMEVVVEPDRPGSNALFERLGFTTEECEDHACCAC